MIENFDEDVLARTIWAEARGENVRGMEAVAAVVMNRVAVAKAHKGYWWGGTVAEVCKKPWQFSCWNRGDPNREKLLGVDEKKDPMFAVAKRIARRAVTDALEDPTGGATHYHAKELEPKWAVGCEPCGTVGRHVFYKAKVAGGDVE